MAGPIENILRIANRKPNEPLNILCMPTHERYETSLAETGHNFYAIRINGMKDWNENYAKVPLNYTLLPPTTDSLLLPPWIDPDLVISQNKACQFQVMQNIAEQLNIPLINIEHTLPPPDASKQQIASASLMQGDINLFVSEHQKIQWNLEGEVIHTGIDIDTFCPPENFSQRQDWALSVVNDWVNRDWCCGFKLWCDIVGFPSPSPMIPTRILGDTPGLSQPAPDIETLVKFYQHAGVYLNTTLVSSLPTVILEAMACGCPVVSTDTCLIPKIIIEHGVNGFVADNPSDLRKYTLQLLKDRKLAKQIGDAGRKTVEQKFDKQHFIEKWNEIFQQAITIRK